MNKEILCTIGPASLNKTVLERMNDLPVTLLRINLSHTSINDLPNVIQFIQSVAKKPICIDTEGAQIRTKRVMGNQVLLQEGSFLNIHQKNTLGNSHGITFSPPETISQIQLFDFISIDFNSVLVQVVEKHDAHLVAKVIIEGWVGNNKAVTVNRPIVMPPLSPKDIAAIKIALDYKIRHFALSFANRAEDVVELRKLTGKDCFIISKIESRWGVANLEAIAKQSDALLIDRGDLSREEPIESIPFLQKKIIQTVKANNRKVYVATNLLESMVTQAKPTRAEVNDVFNTLADGADGLVLAAETAIGKNPIGCVNMIAKLINQYDNFSRYCGQTDKYDKRSLLIEPHGGILINRLLENPDIHETRKLPVLNVDEKIMLDCEQIAFGVYSPIQGFMTKEEVESVLDHNRLPSGHAWTLPILLQTSKNKIAKLQPGDSVALSNDLSREWLAVLHIEQIYTMDLDDLAKRMFGTDSPNHPGVVQIKNSGDMFLGGKIDLVHKQSKPTEIAAYILKPVDTRMIFEQKDWFRIVAFHTRNVIHRAHEFIQMKALHDHHCDGLFISPVVGPKKKNDFLSETTLKSYQTMVDFNLYPKNKVLIGAFLTYSRYAGPREAVFTALCRKNFGCSHFVIGRDHTGVQDFYQTDASAKLFDQLGDIGIKPIFFDEVAYCDACKTQRLDCEHPESNIRRISGTQVRKLLSEEKELPTWLMREEIVEMLIEEIRNKKPVFVA